MSEVVLFLPIIASFIITIAVIPLWIKKTAQIGLVWEDMNKIKSPKVAGSGGIVVVLSFFVGLMLLVFIKTFYYKQAAENLEIFALATSILMLAGIGFLDDLLGWQKGGLSKISRMILVLVASVPLIAINAGRSDISFPFLGTLNLGLFYPLFLIPLGILGASTTFNFLAGFNGLEASLGFILLSSVGVVALLTGSLWLAIVAFIMVVALLGFLFFNKFPAKVFPGDSLTYGVGGLIAVLAILGNFEKIALFFFIPIIIEVLLKSRGKLKKYSFGKPLQDGSLDLNYERIYSLNHLSIFLMKKLNIKPTEKKVVLIISLFQLLVVVLGFSLFWRGIVGNL